MKNRHAAAFTLIEVLITTLVSAVVGGIIYLVASEGLTSFARNASLNRGYTDARSAIDQIAAAIQSAGHAPTLLDANGVPLTTVTSTTAAEGVRFYRYGSLPTYEIASGKSTDTFLNVNYTTAQAPTNGASPIAVGDLVTIPLLGFQATVSGTTVTTNSNGGTIKLTFNTSDGTINKGLPSTPASAINLGYDSTTTPATYYTVLVFQQVAFIAVPNATGGGAQLRYYPQAMSTGNGKACGNVAAFNGSTAFNTAKNYSVVANIAGTVTDSSLTPLKPFLDPDASNILQVTLCGEGPEYNTRNVGSSNTYSPMRSSVGSRCPVLLQTVPAIPL